LKNLTQPCQLGVCPRLDPACALAWWGPHDLHAGVVWKKLAAQNYGNLSVIRPWKLLADEAAQVRRRYVSS